MRLDWGDRDDIERVQQLSPGGQVSGSIIVITIHDGTSQVQGCFQIPAAVSHPLQAILELFIAHLRHLRR